MRTAELAYWINERENMKLRRHDIASLPCWKHGWSDDPHMGTVRYCNVRREDDKVTQWLAEHWRPDHHQVWEILLARLINNTPTLAKLLPDLRVKSALECVRDTLKQRRVEGNTIFGSAYTVSTNGLSMDKVDYIIDKVLHPARNRQPQFDKVWYKGMTLESAANDLMCLHGVSTFMAGQLVADLKNTAGHPLTSAPDWYSWATPGPGSLRGLTAYYGRPITAKVFPTAIQECWRDVQPILGPHVPKLHMQDFQNCLCEFSKYARVKEGGHARNKYHTGDN